MDATTIAKGLQAFRPEVFFVGRTEGSGIVRDPFGRVTRRCDIHTEGVAGPDQRSIQYVESFSYDDGEVDLWRWVITHVRGPNYVGAEEKAGVGIAGLRIGDDFTTTFTRPVGQAQGFFAPRFSTRFTLLAPDLALKSARVSILGVPLAMMTAIHRKVG